MIKTNQILSVGWSLSIGKIWENLWTNQQPSLKWYVKYTIKSESQQNQHRPSAFFTFHAKKVKEILRTSLSGNKITWTETFVRGTLACYEDLPIKPTLKNVQSFLCVTVISRFSSLHCLSSNNSENTNHRHLLWTRTDHSNSRFFWKYSLLEKQSLISEL